MGSDSFGICNDGSECLRGFKDACLSHVQTVGYVCSKDLIACANYLLNLHIHVKFEE